MSEFEDFSRFITTEGLAEETGCSFRSLLRHLFEETGSSWIINDNSGASKIAEHTKALVEKSGLADAQVYLMRYPTFPGRMWTKVKLPEDDLVIDPAGVRDIERGEYLPYFGSIECIFKGELLRDSRRIYNGSRQVQQVES